MSCRQPPLSTPAFENYFQVLTKSSGGNGKVGGNSNRRANLRRGGFEDNKVEVKAKAKDLHIFRGEAKVKVNPKFVEDEVKVEAELFRAQTVTTKYKIDPEDNLF